MRAQGGGPGGQPARGRGIRLGLGGTLVVLVLSVLFGQDFFSVLNVASGGGSTASSVQPQPAATTAEEEALVDFVSFVLDDLQSTWTELLPRYGGRYQDAQLVLFRHAIESACGFSRAATGPFYCPGDANVYVDLSFFQELSRRFGAPGDFAQAYVIAHEIGHHVQNLTGTEAEVRRTQRNSPDSRNRLSVLMELQADCYAGVWGHTTARRELLDPGDIDEGLRAAAAIGDDRLQRQTGGYVNPDSFTHGTSAQRVEWLRRGLQSGDPTQCDTFAGVD